MTVDTATVGAGWYRDPGGTSALRWWDGTQWTDYLHQPDPPAATMQPQAQTQVQGTPQPQVSPVPQAAPLPQQQAPIVPLRAPQQQSVHLSSYSPTTGFVGSPRNQSLVPGYFRDEPYGNGQRPSAQQQLAQNAVAPSNGFAWASLIVGAVALATMLVRESLPSGTFYLPVFGLTAIGLSIRAISRYRRRAATVVWAPILGLILGIAAELLLIVSIVLAQTGIPTTAFTQPQQDTTLGPSGAAMSYDMGVGGVKYLPANDPGITTDAEAESSIVSMIHTAYPTGEYPQGVTLSGTTLKANDGTQIGNLTLPTLRFAYQLRSDGTFVLMMGADNTTEATMYLSKLDEYFAVCEPSDNACQTDSPVAPISISDSSSSGSTT